MGVKKNIEGQRFGNMVVLNDSGLRNNHKVIWTCQCDCGQNFNVRSDKIYNSSVTSCPKCANERKLIDLTNQRFGKLVVLERDYSKKSITRRTAYWICQCDCGNIVSVDGAHLKEGLTQSCGCIKRNLYNEQIIDITGQKFDMLTVLSCSNKKTPNGTYYWICQCECGNIKEISGHALRAHEVISCGCLKRSNGEQKIYNILLNNNIQFEEQKKFDTCKFPNTNYSARYDFYLPDYNLLIEYDGIQHFESNINSWNDEEYFEKIQYRDKYKTQWAQDNNIKLKRIPYYDFNKIDLNYILN